MDTTAFNTPPQTPHRLKHPPPKPNRDRKGALPPIFINVHRHWITLTIGNIDNRGFHVLSFPQIARTSMPAPAAPIGVIQADLIQHSASVCLEFVKYLLRSDGGVNATCT
jgi:hypothetical protein